MKSVFSIRRITMMAATLSLLTSVLPADESATETKPEDSRPSRVQLRDQQYDVTLDARDIERILARLKRASELSKQRMTEAAEAAESVATSIERDPVAARARAEETTKMFQEITKLLEALLTEETPQKVAAARNIAAQLAKAEQQFAQQTKAMSQSMMQSPTTGGGQGQRDPKQPPNKNATKGSGNTKPQEPNDKPNDGSGGKPETENPDGKNGDKADKNEPSDDPQTAGKNGGEPMPNEKPEGGGTKPESDTNKDAQGKNGVGEDKADKEKPDQNGLGGNGTKPEEKNPDDPQAGGTGDATTEDQPDDKRPGSGGGRTEQRPLTEEERREQLAGRAEQLAARAATLLDILESIAKSEVPEDRTAAEKVNALLKETDLKNAVESMQDAAGQIRNQKLEDAQSMALDVADRFQITTQRLDAVYRTLVGPQAEELRKLEQQLVELRDKLEELQTPAQVAAWHRAVAELLDQADELGINEKLREELLEEMKKNGFSPGSLPNLARVQFTDGRYVAPSVYNPKLISLQEEIQSRIQSLVLGEFASMTDDLAPPKYQGLVERYYQVLSQEGSPRTDDANATSTPKSSNEKK